MRVEVQAWQHIYTSVEREQSPHDRGGFQTLFYSHSGLSECEVKEMETRLIYFPSQVDATKRLCATTSTGNVMVAQIVHLAEPDRLGRTGRYLAHNLVFEPQAFERISANPFLIFAQFPFITTIVDALNSGDPETGEIPPAALQLHIPPVSVAGRDAAQAWQPLELKKLALLALRADHLAHDRLSIAVIGPPADVEAALQAALFAVPTPRRIHCSFDTYFHRCNPVNAYYWAIGLLEAPSNRRLMRVNAQARQVERAEIGQPASAYGRWVTTLIEQQRLAEIARCRDHAFAMCEWLEGRACDDALIDSAPDEAVDSVLQTNRQLVQRRLHEKLARTLPPPLVSRAFRQLCSQAWDAELLLQLRTRFRLSEVMEALYRAYSAQEFRPPPSEELAAIEWLLQRADHAFLRVLYLCWMDQRAELSRELQLLSQDEYRHFVHTALETNLVAYWVLPAPNKGNAFLDAYLACDDPAAHSLVAIVQALMRAGESACLSRLAPRIPAQPEHVLRTLAKIVARQPELPEPFQQAVNDAAAALPPRRRGLLARWLENG